MLIALLAVLGVDLIVIVMLLASVPSRKRWVKRQPGAFRGAIRVAGGDEFAWARPDVVSWWATTAVGGIGREPRAGRRFPHESNTKEVQACVVPLEPRSRRSCC